MNVLAIVLLLVPGTAAATPEDRALGYLAREVPRWAGENGCHSCHNNGDAARALYEARRLGIRVAAANGPDPLADTTRWLSKPEGWEKNGGDGPFSDKRLARVQFTSALAAAVASGAAVEQGSLERAARGLADDQAADGSWPIDGEPGVLGSPATYGRPLATLAALEALREADPIRHREAVARAGRWLQSRPVARVMDASVVLLALSSIGPENDDALALRARALDRLRVGRSDDGGWGPYVDAPPEPFDTALALLALARQPSTAQTRAMTAGGRRYLIATQVGDGSWPETTRPAGAESYAQRLSTTGWATLALLATRDARAPGPTRP